MSVEAIQIPRGLAQVLNRAGDKNDVDFDYLVQTAMRESSLNPNAKAQSSSAVGLFQFIESTWLQVLKQEGPRLGYGEYAQAIQRNQNGKLEITNSALRQEIMALREDPQVSADMAAAFTRRNGEYLEQKFGRQPSPGELYIAHFLGPGGAEKMFNAGLSNPEQIAADIFPAQAEANRSIFFDSSGPRTIREVYQALVARHGGGGAPNDRPDPIGANDQSGAPIPVTNAEAGPPQPRYGPPVVQSGTQVSFTSMYQQGGPPIATPQFVVVDPGAALFVQLYGKQGQ